MGAPAMSSVPFETNLFDPSIPRSKYSRHNTRGVRHVEDAYTALSGGERMPFYVDNEPRVATPLTAPLLGRTNRPPLYIPSAPKSTRAVPTFVKAPSPALDDSRPPIPSNTFGSFSSEKSSNESTTSSATCSPPSTAVVTALPGTMSSRKGREKSRARPDAPQRKASLVTRCKLAVKDLFSCREIDESEFVRIEGVHWTEEW